MRACPAPSLNLQSSKKFFAFLLQEAGMMVNLRHPNCVQYLGVCLEPPCLLMVGLRAVAVAQRQ